MFAWVRWHLIIHAKRYCTRLNISNDCNIDSRLYFALSQSRLTLRKGAQLGADGELIAEHGAIELGENVRLRRFWSCKVIAGCDKGLISLGKNCDIEEFGRFRTFGDGKILIGNDVFMGLGCTIAAHECVKIGEGTAMAEYVSIRDHNHLLPCKGPVHLSPMQVKPVSIGKHVWIGAKVTIVAGVSIGDNAVIGANAVVTKDVPEGITVAGVPARPIG